MNEATNSGGLRQHQDAPDFDSIAGNALEAEEIADRALGLNPKQPHLNAAPWKPASTSMKDKQGTEVSPQAGSGSTLCRQALLYLPVGDLELLDCGIDRCFALGRFDRAEKGALLS